MEPAEFKVMVKDIRDAERALGSISYSISKDWRGRGLGTIFLQALPKLVSQYNLPISELVGEIKSQNTISQKAFEHAGFRRYVSGDRIEYRLDLD
jgi:RimJ/RimL family protein N-acetyltransferase